MSRWLHIGGDRARDDRREPADAAAGADAGRARRRTPRVRRASAALRDTATTLLWHPLVLAIAAGVAVAALGLALPAPLQRAVDLMAQASAAVALFVIGGSLVGLQLQGQRLDLAAVAAGKLVLHPLAVAALAWWLLADNTLLRTAAIALAAMPMLGIYRLLAQKHGHEGFCAATLLVTTVAFLYAERVAVVVVVAESFMASAPPSLAPTQRVTPNA